MVPQKIAFTKQPPRWQVEVGQRLALTRVALGLKDADLARYLGISQQRWHNYVSGIRPLQLALAVKLCDRFKLTLDWLYRGDFSGLPFDLAQRMKPLDLGETRQSTN